MLRRDLVRRVLGFAIRLDRGGTWGVCHWGTRDASRGSPTGQAGRNRLRRCHPRRSGRKQEISIDNERAVVLHLLLVPRHPIHRLRLISPQLHPTIGAPGVARPRVPLSLRSEQGCRAPDTTAWRSGAARPATSSSPVGGRGRHSSAWHFTGAIFPASTTNVSVGSRCYARCNALRE